MIFFICKARFWLGKVVQIWCKSYWQFNLVERLCIAHGFKSIEIFANLRAVVYKFVRVHALRIYNNNEEFWQLLTDIELDSTKFCLFSTQYINTPPPWNIEGIFHPARSRCLTMTLHGLTICVRYVKVLHIFLLTSSSCDRSTILWQ